VGASVGSHRIPSRLGRLLTSENASLLGSWSPNDVTSGIECNLARASLVLKCR
jgi:hypothetical protein